MKNRIKECRIERGMTQKALGKAINVNRRAISRWESGIVESRKKAWEQLANALNVTPEYLVGWSNIPQTLKQMMKPDRAKTHNS